jgi:hypothetical protein
MSSSSNPSTPSGTSDSFTASEWTEQNMLTDLMQQKGLLIGAGVLIALVLFFKNRSRPDQKAARRLVRDWRHVDDRDDVRDLLGENLPTILRPVLLILLQEIERQVQRGFDNAERSIERL